ncbi:MAG: hypothetical protein WBA64_16245, partial [Marinomonas sp.]|uniref:hypothetical protein n=1 Tax=Marinomonas sp. TaxID=1904862 RepID=UPI003C7863F7
HGSRVWLFLAKLLITKGHERSLLALTNCYLYQIRGDTSGSDPSRNRWTLCFSKTAVSCSSICLRLSHKLDASAQMKNKNLSH